MKYSIFLAVIIWNSLAFSGNSRIRDEKWCSIQDSYNGQAITVNFTVDIGDDCTSLYQPYELGCTVRTPHLDLENSSCFKRTETEVSIRTDKDRLIKAISGIYKVNTSECAATTIPQEYLSNIVCHNIVEFREEHHFLKIPKKLIETSPEDDRLFFKKW